MRLPSQNAAVMPSYSFDSFGGYAADVCASVIIRNGQVCVDLPVVGTQCIPITLPIPSGTAASACIDVCKKWGIPTGACVTVTALGQQIVKKCFGLC
jgi:hypothetical protein